LDEEKFAMLISIFNLTEYSLDLGKLIGPETCMLLEHLAGSELMDRLCNTFMWTHAKRVMEKVRVLIADEALSD